MNDDKTRVRGWVANGRQERLERAHLYLADLTGVDLRGADLYGAKLSNAAYSDATQWPNDLVD